MRIATGIDLPANAPGGSVELFHDLYTALDAPFKEEAWAFMLGPGHSSHRELVLFDGAGKCIEAPAFHRYVTGLAEQLREQAPTPNILHLQHLAFGASPALVTAFPNTPAIALIHGTDLLSARESLTQHAVLTRVAHHSRAVVVPVPPTGLRSQVRYLGWFERRELWAEFTRHDLLIMPSTDLEAFGLVAIEAQSCGLPVLYHQVPSLTDTLGDTAIGIPDLTSSPRLKAGDFGTT